MNWFSPTTTLVEELKIQKPKVFRVQSKDQEIDVIPIGNILIHISALQSGVYLTSIQKTGGKVMETFVLISDIEEADIIGGNTRLKGVLTISQLVDMIELINKLNQ